MVSNLFSLIRRQCDWRDLAKQHGTARVRHWCSALAHSTENVFPLQFKFDGHFMLEPSKFQQSNADVIKWKLFPRYWPFVWGIHLSPVNSPHKGHWRGALMFSLICVWINGWVNKREAGNLRRHRTHYDVIVMVVTTKFCTIDEMCAYRVMCKISGDQSASNWITAKRFFIEFELRTVNLDEMDRITPVHNIGMVRIFELP